MTERGVGRQFDEGPAPVATRPVDDAIAKRLFECVTSIEPIRAVRPRSTSERTARAARGPTPNTGGNRLFYLASPPEHVRADQQAAWPHRHASRKERHLAAAGRREPFGTDLASAKALNELCCRLLDEHQIYRIDHYLGKERCRTSWCFASPTASSSRSGTAITSITSRSRSTKSSASAVAAASTTNRRPARHGAESSLPAALAGRDGAAGEIRRRGGAFGKGRSAGGDPDPGEAEALRDPCAASMSAAGR